jgi:PadR family transcriptional regulator, regulatory protein AphA
LGLKPEDDKTFSQSTYGILAILSEGAKSGYEIKKFLSAPEVFYWRESYGNIYPILRRMKSHGFVRQIDADVKKKRRIYYEITDEGRKELARWLTTPPELTRFRVEILMKLRFGEMSGIENMKANIEHYRKLNDEDRDECRELIRSLKQDGDIPLQDEIRVLTALFLLRFKEAMDDWCTESIEILDQWIKDHSADQ